MLHARARYQYAACNGSAYNVQCTVYIMLPTSTGSELCMMAVVPTAVTHLLM